MIALALPACAAEPPPRIPVYLPVVRAPWLAPRPAQKPATSIEPAPSAPPKG